MPTQDNCDDLKVESCVDENGQTINGGDSYEVPTGRYVKHVVNVCGSGGSGSGMKVCADSGLELIGSGDAQCMQIITEPDGALVIDNGILKIDSTKVKVTSDNVFPAGTDPGLLSTVPTFTAPDGEVFDNQYDYNQWLYNDQKRQDQEIEDLKNAPSGGGQMVFWGILPKDAPQGALWTDQDTLKMYVHTGGGTWAQVAQCAGDDTDTIVETPWIRIDEMRVLRQYSGWTNGSDSHITKILYADYHYNDRFPSTITDEWEWDEDGDGNWVAYDPRTDSEADSHLDDSNYFYYLWSCEAHSGVPAMDPGHPHPCAKLRSRLTNTWDDGQSETSDWFEVWLAKEQNPAMNYPYQAPSIC